MYQSNVCEVEKNSEKSAEEEKRDVVCDIAVVTDVLVVLPTTPMCVYDLLPSCH